MDERQEVEQVRTALFRTGEPGELRLDRRQWTLLVLAAASLWVIVYGLINLSWFTPSAPYPAERAARRLLTCAAGFGLCMTMVPWMMKAALAPIRQRILIAVVASLAAYGLHLATRLAAFHLIWPLWGPLSGHVVIKALQGAGWMFPLWAVICLAVFAEMRRVQSTAPRRSPEDPAAHLWFQDGGRRFRVDLNDLTLVAAEGDYVRLHTSEKQHLVRGRLKDLAATLPAEQFMRVHRSSIVRLDAVQTLERAGSVWRIRLRDGHETLVSRPMGKAVRERIDVAS
ncbi:LytR/AlgR family response regulator transcription factor [Caulobacter sp. NIBR2454]|uniref:LytR/AlgR family response regulator transcription factor n=1 Tax=Caulobacter sp. NIBR2454 TaxID=3015996 RepID=UPI0022B683C7|nr:LytTR family DNA-binding domain-containing protein [Caulobacter sp. NIBR2454]